MSGWAVVATQVLQPAVAVHCCLHRQVQHAAGLGLLVFPGRQTVLAGHAAEYTAWLGCRWCAGLLCDATCTAWQVKNIQEEYQCYMERVRSEAQGSINAQG